MAFHFEGFSAPNGTFVPDEVFDVLAPELTEAELRVLLYIIRRTFGFKKDHDNISLKQMTEGITTREGKVLDRGTGLSKAGNARGVKGLIEKRVVVATRNRSAEKGDQPTTYAIHFRDTTVADNGGGGQYLYRSNKQPASNDPVTIQRRDTASIESPESLKETGGCPPDRQGGVYQIDTQETELQQTDSNHSNIRKQHTAFFQKPKLKQARPGASAKREERREFMSLNTVLSKRHTPTSEGSTDDPEARDAIRAYIADIAPRFNDQARLESSVGRAYHLYQAAHLPLGAFLSRLLEVSSAVRERQSKVKKLANGGKATMPYYFACLEDNLGLRKQGSGSPPVPGHITPHSKARRSRPNNSARFSPASASSLAGEQGGNCPPPHTHSFAHPQPQGWRAQSGQLSADARSASAAPS
jgi:hypothetical protein